MLTVYVTNPSTPLRAGIELGAGIVGEDSDAERTLVYYQPRTSAVNVISFADRVYHAADRLRHQTPTSKMCAPRTSELIAVGYFDETEGRVVLTEHGAEAHLAVWLGQPQLDVAELECKGTEHFARRRELQAAMRSPNPGLAQWARGEAQRRGISA